MSGVRVFVGNLPYGVKERDIEHFFRSFGRLREILMKGAYAFVEFKDQRDADDAVYELNGERIFGERVTVERARGLPRGRSGTYRGSRTSRSRYERKVPPYTRTEHRVIVENLSTRCSWQDLKDYLRKAGEVTYADAHRPYSGEGIVEFASYSDMKNVIEMLDDTKVYGQRIRLIEDRPKRGRRSVSTARSRSRSRRRSVSRSRSRSRSRRSRCHSKSRSKSKSPEEKSRSRSRSMSKVKRRTKSPCPSKTTSRSKSKSVERNSHSKSRSRSRSRSRSVSRDRSISHSRSISRDRSISHSRSVSRDRSILHSRSVSRDGSKSHSRSVSRDGSKTHSRSKSRDRSMRSRSKSRSQY